MAFLASPVNASTDVKTKPYYKHTNENTNVWCMFKLDHNPGSHWIRSDRDRSTEPFCLCFPILSQTRQHDVQCSFFLINIYDWILCLMTKIRSNLHLFRTSIPSVRQRPLGFARFSFEALDERILSRPLPSMILSELLRHNGKCEVRYLLTDKIHLRLHCHLSVYARQSCISPASFHSAGCILDRRIENEYILFIEGRF